MFANCSLKGWELAKFARPIFLVEMNKGHLLVNGPFVYFRLNKGAVSMVILWIGLIWGGTCTFLTMLWVLLSFLSQLQFQIIQQHGNFFRPAYQLEHPSEFSAAH